MSYGLFVVAVAIEFIFQKIFRIDSKIINIILALCTEIILIFRIIRIKRLKNGLLFLKKKLNDYIEIALINISMLLVLIYGLIGTSYQKVIEHIFFYFILLIIFMILIVQKTIVMYYKQKLIDDTINQYEKDIQEKDAEIKRLTNENYKISKTNHEFYNRQKALEHMVKKSVENYNIEAGKELEILDRINDLTVEHSEKMNENRNLPKLDLTDIPEIDDMFKYMQNECEKNNIQFKLKVEGNIHILVNNYISTSRLVTLIGDHIRDAIIAINFSPEETNKSIFVILGVKENCYELCIYDTGIEFEIDTLLKLGINPVTTHKKFGGSGIGFMTTFETLKECKASLIIEEKNSKPNNNYTKAIIIRFDGNNEYKIYTYRAKEIIKINNRADLCITEKNT